MAHSLTDDGTLDTVIRCDACGHETRFSYTENGDANDTNYFATQSPDGFWRVMRKEYERYAIAGKFATEQDAKIAINEELYNAYAADCIAELDTQGCENCLDADGVRCEVRSF